MSVQIFALLFVVASFTALFVWVFLPKNRERFEAEGRAILEPTRNSKEGDVT